MSMEMPLQNLLEIDRQKLESIVRAQVISSEKYNGYRPGTSHFIAGVLNEYLGKAKTDQIFRDHKARAAGDIFPRYAAAINEIIKEIKGGDKTNSINQPVKKNRSAARASQEMMGHLEELYPGNDLDDPNTRDKLRDQGYEI